MSNIISIRLEGFGHRNELFDISKASIDYENEKNSDSWNSDYWYDDFSENQAYLDCDEIISYSLPFYNEKLKIFIEGWGIHDDINEVIGNDILEEKLHLDRLFTKENEDR